MKKYLVILFIITALYSNCTKSNYPDAPSEVDQNKILELVNEVRQKGCDCGSEYFPAVENVVWNEKLETAAQNHSYWMNKNNKLDHTGDDNSSPGDRITDAGYDWTTYGENIAAGYTTEELVIEGWLKSDGHCKNIMNGKFEEMGLATSGSYWTQVFATK